MKYKEKKINKKRFINRLFFKTKKNIKTDSNSIRNKLISALIVEISKPRLLKKCNKKNLSELC